MLGNARKIGGGAAFGKLSAGDVKPLAASCPFDPLAVLDEIERLVPGYTLDRINLFAATM